MLPCGAQIGLDWELYHLFRQFPDCGIFDDEVAFAGQVKSALHVTCDGKRVVCVATTSQANWPSFPIIGLGLPFDPYSADRKFIMNTGFPPNLI